MQGKLAACAKVSRYCPSSEVVVLAVNPPRHLASTGAFTMAKPVAADPPKLSVLSSPHAASIREAHTATKVRPQGMGGMGNLLFFI